QGSPASPGVKAVEGLQPSAAAGDCLAPGSPRSTPVAVRGAGSAPSRVLPRRPPRRPRPLKVETAEMTGDVDRLTDAEEPRNAPRLHRLGGELGSADAACRHLRFGEAFGA